METHYKPKIIWWSGLLLLLFASSAFASEITVRLETSAGSYTVGDNIEVRIFLDQESTLFPYPIYPILGPSLLLSVNDPAKVDLFQIQGNDGNIYPPGSITAKLWTIPLLPPAQVQVVGPATIGNVDTKQQLLATVTLPAKAAIDGLIFSVHPGSKIRKADGKTEYSLSLIPTGSITITEGSVSCDAEHLTICIESSCTAADLYWYNNQCYISCPAETQVQEGTHNCVVSPPPDQSLPPDESPPAECGNNIVEEGEACEGSTGCPNCEYIEVGYKGENCNVGANNCVVLKMAPKELLREKLNALLDAKCYPYPQHPQKEFCDENGNFEIDYARFDSRQKISFIGKVAAVLGAFFTEVVAPS